MDKATVQTAISLLTKLEWSSYRRGPGTSMGSNNGDLYKACPICGGLKTKNSEFYKSAVGHTPKCRLGKFIETNRPK